MRKPALAIALAMGMAVVSSPTLAGEFIVENDSEIPLDVGCASLQTVPSGGESGVVSDCSGRIDVIVQQDSYSYSRNHAHNCSDPENPIHRILVTGGAPDVPTAGEHPWGWPWLEFAHVCEAAS